MGEQAMPVAGLMKSIKFAIGMLSAKVPAFDLQEETLEVLNGLHFLRSRRYFHRCLGFGTRTKGHCSEASLG